MSEVTRLSINVSKDLMDKIDAYADSLYLNRTSAVTFLLAQSLKEYEAMQVLKDIAPIMQSNEFKEYMEKRNK